MNAIEIAGLRKRFRRGLGGGTVAVDGLDLEVPTGTVFGFLGPNGSGKTTTIRCLLGLVRADGGSCRVLGAETPAQLAEVADRIGSIVESPAFFGAFSGRRNLELLADAARIPKHRCEEALERVRLASRAGDRVRTYSLGMRQRLALAASLMKDPELLVLDEPGNGLDPAGLKELRDLLRSLADEGRTVFLSSHLLSEVQLICDAVGIVSRGRCLAAGPVDEVLAAGRAATLTVRVPNLRRAQKVLRDAGFDVAVDGDRLRVTAGTDDAGRVTKALAEEEIYLTELRPAEVSLEDVFLEVTGGETV